MAFRYIDLFAGIGGFHAAMSALGGELVFASEIDNEACNTYERNWGVRPSGDITRFANDEFVDVPEHDVLLAGFPCQPFSKSGAQRGMDEARGTLFWNIARIIEVRRPKIVLLENVRNIAGPRHKHEWDVIIKTLRDFGYRVDEKPLVVSPHLIHPKFGGRPQIRERVFIGATHVGNADALGDVPAIDLSSVCEGWNPQSWDLKSDLPLDSSAQAAQQHDTSLSHSEQLWLKAWDDFVISFRKAFPADSLPGFPLWTDEWRLEDDLVIPVDTPKWKSDFLVKNAKFYEKYQVIIDAWMKRWNGLDGFPPSRKKFEWQAQDSISLQNCVVHFRPSGLRVKKATYLPALVAITQTSILVSESRRISVREAARLQGLPESFTFGSQRNPVSYKQLGNGVNVAAVFHTFLGLLRRDWELLGEDQKLFASCLEKPTNPDSCAIEVAPSFDSYLVA